MSDGVCAGPARWMCTVGYGHLCEADEPLTCVFAGPDCAGEVTTDNPYDDPWCDAHTLEFERVEMIGILGRPAGDEPVKPTLAEVLAR